MRLSHCHNIYDLRLRAKRKLPAPIFHYIDGGAEDEWTLRRNSGAFNDYELIPNYLTDVSNINTATRLFNRHIDWPVILSPTGMNRLFHHQAEPAVARAAAKSGTFYTLSTLATTSLENIAKETGGPKIFQIYILKDRGLTAEFVQRCKVAGYDALCLTVDTAIAGNRERDLVHGMSMPPRFTAKSLWSYATHFEWALNLLLQPQFTLANISSKTHALGTNTTSVADYINNQFDPSICWDDAAWLAELWGGPLTIKGVHSVHDALKAKEIGATSIMISNHGGRQLDGAPAAVDCLPPIKEALKDDLELIVDGGIRRGSHVVKALALGADAVSIGRPYLYGLAAGGEAGVEKALHILKTEVARCMALLGCRTSKDINRRHVQCRTRLASNTTSEDLSLPENNNVPPNRENLRQC
ncbi:MAG: alpha-hydroxy acid oxidase [Porticoccaceae bacterium]|nr:alpha-hydroxy-acid oxidizing protein [Pseudomonadales bacterium]MCP5170696.1 alpha-hydroxy-acid oxidizing protein [Pseudomonadales bacterium]MCP5302063.1 alpha-hydroxy-acid oxidizing protein [Pseudomonadales bacterium]